MNYEQIKEIKREILENLKYKISRITPSVYQNDKLELIIILGTQKTPTEFDLKIKFHKADDFDTFDLVSAIKEKLVEKIDEESLQETKIKNKEIDDKYANALLKAKSEFEKQEIIKQIRVEKSSIDKIKTITYCGVAEDVIIEAIEKMVKKFPSIINKMKIKD